MTREPLVEEIQNYAQNIVDTVREPLLILDATLRVRSANRAFYQTFHVSPAETEGRLIYELGNGQWDIPDLRTLLEDIVPKSSVFNDFELEHTFPVIGRRVARLPGQCAKVISLASMFGREFSLPLLERLCGVPAGVTKTSGFLPIRNTKLGSA